MAMATNHVSVRVWPVYHEMVNFGIPVWPTQALSIHRTWQTHHHTHILYIHVRITL